MSDMIDRQVAIDTIAKLPAIHGSEGSWVNMGEAIEKLKSMPSAQSKNTDCIYCREDSDGYVKPIEKNGHAFIRFGMNGWEISLGAKGWNGSAKIMYCPVCGRRLGDG